MPRKPISLTDWIAHVFDHPVTDPAWHWDIDAARGACGAVRGALGRARKFTCLIP
jgi:hypothetical protein